MTIAIDRNRQMLLASALTCFVLAAPLPADQTPAAAAPASPPETAPAERGTRIYILKPRYRNQDHLHSIASTLRKVDLADRVEVDPFSGTLVVRSDPGSIAEIERVVKTLEAPEEASVRVPRQVSLDVKVVLATHDELDSKIQAPLDEQLSKWLRELFGYKSMRLVGSQHILVEVGSNAKAEAVLKDPGSERKMPCAFAFTVRPAGQELRIQAEIDTSGFGSKLQTTFLARPDQTILLGNSSLESGEALVYLVTPMVFDDKKE